MLDCSVNLYQFPLEPPLYIFVLEKRTYAHAVSELSGVRLLRRPDQLFRCIAPARSIPKIHPATRISRWNRGRDGGEFCRIEVPCLQAQALSPTQEGRR